MQHDAMQIVTREDETRLGPLGAYDAAVARLRKAIFRQSVPPPYAIEVRPLQGDRAPELTHDAGER